MCQNRIFPVPCATAPKSDSPQLRELHRLGPGGAATQDLQLDVGELVRREALALRIVVGRRDAGREIVEQPGAARPTWLEAVKVSLQPRPELLRDPPKQNGKLPSLLAVAVTPRKNIGPREGAHLVTAAGGLLQNVWAGYGGVRFERDDALTIRSPRPLPNSTVLRLRCVHYLGAGLDIVAVEDATIKEWAMKRFHGLDFID